MKKRNLFVAFVMSLVMLFTACGNSEQNQLVGKWVGTLDLTSYITAGMVEEDATMEKYLEFENLTLTYVFEFTEDEVSLHLDETSTQNFVTNMENGIVNMIDAMAADMAAENDMTVEDVYATMGVTYEELVQSSVDSMHMDEMISAMAESLDLSGTYVSDQETIIVYYDDNTYEEIEYILDGDKLSITVSDGTNDFIIECTKEAE